MATESGDKKLLGNFRKLIDEVSADPNYNPANSKLKKSALEARRVQTLFKRSGASVALKLDSLS